LPGIGQSLLGEPRSGEGVALGGWERSNA